MTITGHLGTAPDLKQLYEHGHMIPYWWIGEGILKIELGLDKKGICTEDILHESTKDKKRFFNQSSIVFRLAIDNRHKEINIKIFKNGGFQMTGVSSETMARAALTRFMELNKDRGIWSTEPYIQTFNIRMMNSDYTIGKAIRRDRLHKLLVEKYGLWSSFEPTIYQGVNTKFFWNKTRSPAAPPGICVCPQACDGNGAGYAVGECKKITISPFRTGSIIITGAKDMDQLNDAYTFMNKVLLDHADHILRDDTEVIPTTKKKTALATTAEAILKQKMRASPRNIVSIAVGSI